MEGDETRYVFGTVETRAPPPFEQSQIAQAEQRLKKTLKKLRKEPFMGEEPGLLAGKARLIPGFVHLNPELLGAAFYFRRLTEEVPLNEISDSKRDQKMKKVLYEIFPSVRRNEGKYAGLKADLIRYLMLIEKYFI